MIRLQLGKISRSHREVFESLRDQGVGVNLHYIPIHAQPHYARMGFRAGDYPQAEAYYREVISLPMYQTLTDEQQDQVITALSKALTT